MAPKNTSWVGYRVFFISLFNIVLFSGIPSLSAFQVKTIPGFSVVGARPLYFGGLNDLAKSYEEKSGVNIFTTAGGCKTAKKEMEHSPGLSLGAWCCPVRDGLDDEIGVIRIPIAMDAIAIYVHPSNPVNNISMEQIRGIYRGEIVNWAELGGVNKPIVPIARKHCRDFEEVFRKKVIGEWDKYETKTNWLEVKSIEKMIENVGKFPLAIGYESHVFAERGEVKILKVNGIFPDSDNIQSKRYPLWRVLSLTVPKSDANHPVIKSFIDFTLGPEGQAILRNKLVSISQVK